MSRLFGEVAYPVFCWPFGGHVFRTLPAVKTASVQSLAVPAGAGREGFTQCWGYRSALMSSCAGSWFPLLRAASRPALRTSSIKPDSLIASLMALFVTQYTAQKIRMKPIACSRNTKNAAASSCECSGYEFIGGFSLFPHSRGRQ